MTGDRPAGSPDSDAAIRLRDGLRLHLRTRGRGSPVLLLHGFTGSAEAWPEPVVDGLAERGLGLLIPDLPGHGRSAAPPDPARYRMGALLDDLEELLDRSGVGSCPWVGYSMGGRVALGAAVLRPGRVSRLVLESASPGLPTARRRAARRRSDRALARRIEEEGMEWFVDHWMGLPIFRSQRSLPPEVLRGARERRRRQRPEGLAGSLRGLGTGAQPPFGTHLPDVTTPTLLLVGEEDEKYVAISERMADALPRARRVVVAGVGHTVHLEAPERWLRAVDAFLSGTAEAR